MGEILVQYLIWHFFEIPKGILKAWKNFLLFNLNYFSVPLLLKTFFSPWRGYRQFYGKKFEFKKNIEILTLNAMSRIIGMILRILFIILGILGGALMILAGAVVFLLWLIMPAFLIFLIFFGIRLLLL